MAQADRIVDQLLKIARKERELLIAGHLEKLSTLEAQKDALLRRLRQVPGYRDAKALSQLKAQAENNQNLYGSALKGIARARDQIATILGNQNREFQTYGQTGDRNTIGRQEPQVRRRA